MTPPKLTVDSAGRVQGANVTHNSPWPCPNGDNGGMTVPSGIMGLIMHTMVGNLPGTISVFNNGAYQASAHFGVDQSGNIHQFGSVRGWKAWAEVAGNAHWYSCEFADNGNPSNPLTPAQINAGAQLLECLSASGAGNFTMQVTDSTSKEGFGVHRMGGAAWGGHSCPQNGDGSGPRAGQRTQILAVAQEIRGTAAATSTVAGWLAQGQKSLADLCSGSLHNGVSTVLRLTAERSPGAVYAPAMATYLNGVFAADKARIPAGVVLFYPKGSGDEAFTSRGDQTLQGLANTWHCECSAIVRLTAEKSPGAVFSGAMATYLDGVFQRAASGPKVPAGVHLYYET